MAFRFSNINLQDSNHNEPLSHGYLLYSIKPVAGLLPYQKIKNSASIYFDFEAPVLTNTTENYWKLKPTLTLKGKTKDTIDLCGTYLDPGATAVDDIDGNISGNIQIFGNVKDGVTGNYVLVYSITTSYGQTVNAARTVEVMDLAKPHIILFGKNIVNNMTVPVQVSSLFQDKVTTVDTCNSAAKITIVPGFNGPVNTAIRTIYPVSYFASDSAGNKAWENGFTINYTVEDAIPPVILLNTNDTVYHQINTPYISVAVAVTDNYFPVKDIVLVKYGTVDANKKGLYPETFVAVDPAGNADTAIRYVRVQDTNSISVRTSLQQPLKIWPNPADRTIHIFHAEPISKIYLFDIHGRVLFRHSGETGMEVFTMDISGFPQGVFVVKVCGFAGCIESQVVIIH